MLSRRSNFGGMPLCMQIDVKKPYLKVSSGTLVVNLSRAVERSYDGGYKARLHGSANSSLPQLQPLTSYEGAERLAVLQTQS